MKEIMCKIRHRIHKAITMLVLCNIVTVRAESDTVISRLPSTMVEIPGQRYAICKYEVTQGLWEEVMAYKNHSRFQGKDLPVENVSWKDCQEFLAKLNALPEVKKSGWIYRLPTVREWEYACRAGSTGDYCKLEDGTEITKETLGDVAWYDCNSEGKTHPVGQKKPNAFGLYDMNGNVCEWCLDLYCFSFRVFHGGGYSHDYKGCRASRRIRVLPGDRGDTLGFRLAAFRRVNR